MSKLNKQSEEEMVQCIAHLLKSGIYLYGTGMPFSIDNIASHLVASGCRIHVGLRRRKWLNEETNTNEK